MKLWIGRHSYAGDEIPDDPKAERERSLTKAGIRIAKGIAEAMKALGEEPTVIFASPYVRATQTADIYGQLFQVRVNSVGDFSPDRPFENGVLDIISHGELKRVMIVGHMDNTTPGMKWLGGDSKWPDLVMGEVRRVRIERKGGSWKLRWSIKPSDIGLEDYE